MAGDRQFLQNHKISSTSQVTYQ